jgi:hypothetical protein
VAIGQKLARSAILMKHAQPTLRKPVRRDVGASDLDPSKLGTTLRELSLRAHELVRAIDSSDLGTDESEQELTEVHAQIVRLERTLGAHQLDDLAIYVSALRQRVAECLA